MAELAQEDALRLNVLLASAPQAIRIHESSMTVFGLTPTGEASVPLHPSGRDEQYLKAVREMISGHVLGSPGGYPVFLRRWTRMGQMRDTNLDQLLMLGEPEAVVAVVCAKGLTDELARRAWWAMDEPENARRMLSNPAVVEGQMGKVLAHYLVEHLAFETEPEAQIETVRLVLQPGLIDSEEQQRLWAKAQQKRVYKLGFLISRPDHLPESLSGREDESSLQASLSTLANTGNPVAKQLLLTASAAGQTWLNTAEDVLAKPNNQEVVYTLMQVIANYFSALRPEADPDLDMPALEAEADAWMAAMDQQPDEPAAQCLHAGVPATQLLAARVLSGLGYGVVRPVFAKTTAIGSVMRKRLRPVTERLEYFVALLR